MGSFLCLYCEKRSGLPENGFLRWPLLLDVDRGNRIGCGELACFSKSTLGGINGKNGIYYRGERRMGELLAETVKPGNPQFSHGENIGRLKDIGIDHNQSHQHCHNPLILKDNIIESN